MHDALLWVVWSQTLSGASDPHRNMDCEEGSYVQVGRLPNLN